MAFWIFGDYFSTTWTLAIGAILIFLAYDWWCHQFFQRAGIPVVPYYPIVGNAISWFKKGNATYAEECVLKYGKVVGIYNFRTPILYVSDVDMVKKIFVTDFHKFPNHWDIPAAGFPLNGALMFMKGQRWREIRAIISPAFTASKLRQMVDIFSDCCDPLLGNFGKAHDQNKPLDCKKIYLGFFVQTAMAVIFGLDVQSQSNLDHPFVTNVEKAFCPRAITILPMIFPSLAPLFELAGANIFSKDAVAFFLNTINKSTQGVDEDKIRQTSWLGDNKYITLVEMYLKNTDIPGEADMKKKTQASASTPKKLSYREFLCAMVTLLAGGNEATSTFLICTTYLLALNPEVQDKLIEEIDRVAPKPEDITYETMAKMSYAEMVVNESFRMYPPSTVTDRVCSETVTYGKYTLKKGIRIDVPIYPVQHDPEVWSDPEKFDPERFSPENKDSNNPAAWIVFGIGPRHCLAIKFVMVLAKVFLARVFQKYRFEACPETPKTLRCTKMTMLEPQDVFVRVVPRDIR